MLSNTWWFITFIDDHSGLSWVYLVRNNYEVCLTFQQFDSMIETQFQTKILMIQTDNESGYFSTIFGSFFEQKGIIHH